MLPPSFALAVVRSKGFIASKEQQNEEGIHTEVEFFLAPDDFPLKRHEIASISKIVYWALGTSNPNENGSDIEEEEEEHEIFNRDIDPLGFRDPIFGTFSDERRQEGSCFYFHLPPTHANTSTFRGIACVEPNAKEFHFIQKDLRMVVIVSNLPYFSFMREKIEPIVYDFFKQADEFATNEILANWYKSTVAIDFSTLTYRQLFSGLPIVHLIKWFGKEIIGILRLLLLEGRIVLFSSHTSTASWCTLGLLAMIPGLIATSTGFSSRSLQVGLYRLKRYGMPLAILNEDFLVQPCFTHHDQAEIYSRLGFLVGTSDTMLLKNPENKFDVIIDLDAYDVITFPTVKTAAAFAIGSSSAAFADSLAEKLGRNFEKEEQAKGSEPHHGNDPAFTYEALNVDGPINDDETYWVLNQFQAYFENFLAEALPVAFTLGLESASTPSTPTTAGTPREKSSSSLLSFKGSALVNLAAPVLAYSNSLSHLFGSEDEFFIEYGRAWFDLWEKTHNYERWQYFHRSERRKTSAASAAANGSTQVFPPPKEGQACYTYANGDEYEGTFLNGKRHGFGIYIEAMTQNQYEGDWKQDQRHGKGILTCKSQGYIYDGSWENDMRHGYGNSTMKNGESYSGNWCKNLFSGQGTFSNANGDVYDGEWNMGVREGVGKLTMHAYHQRRGHNDMMSATSSSNSTTSETAPVKSNIGVGGSDDTFGGLAQYTGEWKQNKFNGMGTTLYVDGTNYTGGFLDGKRHGNGVLVFANGDKFEGQWWKNFRHGEGIFFSKTSGITREGKWRKNEEVEYDNNGELGGGEVTWFLKYSNGDKYSGTCRRGRPWGKGVCKYANGSSYDGEWVDGLREGHGIFISAEGEIMEGEWKNSVFIKKEARTTRGPASFVEIPLSLSSPKRSFIGESSASINNHLPTPSPSDVNRKTSPPSRIETPKSGSHVFTYPNGDVYEGDFCNYQREGEGILTERSTGNVYDGSWKKDLRHGHGILMSGTRDFIYDGNWEQDMRTGYGNCVIRDCESYAGEWKNNQFHGMGKYSDAEGNIYEGEFSFGKKHGAGKEEYAYKKEIYRGEWQNGQRHGIGDATYPDGSIYSGGWMHDQRHGEGTLTLASGEKYIGQFRHGIKEGPGVWISVSGITKEGTWMNDIAVDGDWTIQFPDGSKYTGNCVRGRPHGRGVCKYANDDLYDGQWVNGKRHGFGLGFFANGESFEGEWENNHVALNGRGKLTLSDGTVHVYSK
jgi:hypothetical protein